jgi:flagellar basal-body rod modification protein FlgD
MSAVSSSLNSGGQIRSDYLNLLVTQLRNQNPLEPMDSNEMASQLALFSQLEQLENMSSTFQRVLLTEQRSQAADLIGKQISFRLGDAFAEEDRDIALTWEQADEEVAGVVEGVDVADGAVRVKVGSLRVDLTDIRSIRNQQ